MCKVGDGLSRPVLIARETFSYRKISRKKSFYFILFSVLSSNICRGYSGEEPPLPIPNREVKLTIADGTAPPGGRVGPRVLLLPDLFVLSPSLNPASCPCPSTAGCALLPLFAHLRVLQHFWMRNIGLFCASPRARMMYVQKIGFVALFRCTYIRCCCRVDVESPFCAIYVSMRQWVGYN